MNELPCNPSKFTNKKTKTKSDFVWSLYFSLRKESSYPNPSEFTGQNILSYFGFHFY